MPQRAGRGNARSKAGARSKRPNLEGAVEAAVPRSLRPELATLVKEPPEGGDWFHEIKYDGYRVLSFVRDGSVRLISRNGNDWTSRFGRVARAVRDLHLPDGILDGEVAAVQAGGKTSFQRLQNVLELGEKADIQYYAFDLPFFDGYDLRQCTLVDRKALLKSVLTDAGQAGVVRYSDHIQGDGGHVLSEACKIGLEGIVSKRASSTYVSSRTRSWLKIKCAHGQEFVIVGYTDPMGSRRGFGALLLGHYVNGDLVYCGKVGTGFDEEKLESISGRLKRLARRTSPLSGGPVPAERGVHWVRPELVGQVAFGEWTDDGRLRHPAFQGLRLDKKASEVRREMPVETRGEATVAGVHLTHPDRVMYDRQGITKLDLAKYYEDIAEWILPHVVDRPIAVVRCPEGEADTCFYQKHVTDSMPKDVHGVGIQEKRKKAEYIMVKDLAGVVSLVQMGVLEIHAWGSTARNVEKPDTLVFDLDPAEEVPWKDVVHGAIVLGDKLRDLDLEPFVRTTGGKGLHVVAPLAPSAGWDEVKEFAKGVAQRAAREAPERYVATMSKARRKGKIFIDYLRNSRGATAIVSYSTRAKPGAPIATPLRWDELATLESATAYDFKNIRRRLSSQKSDPWKGFFKIR